jgi:hypothetical protein
MRNGKLSVHKVRRYRVARYPSRHPEAKRVRSISERVLRGAAVPTVALGLGAAGGACDGGTNLVGTDPDAGDVPTMLDTPTTEVVPSEDDAGGSVDVPVGEDVPPDYVEPEGLMGDMPAGTWYTRYFSEAEGRQLMLDAIRESEGLPIPPCAPLVLSDRLNDDQPFVAPGDRLPPVNASIDLLSEPYVAPCMRGSLPAVGFEWMTEEARDDEDVTRNPAGLTDEEEDGLAILRETGSAAISVLKAADFSYQVYEEYGGGSIDESDRPRAEAQVRDAVRAIVEDLLRDGLI